MFQACCQRLLELLEGAYTQATAFAMRYDAHRPLHDSHAAFDPELYSRKQRCGGDVVGGLGGGTRAKLQGAGWLQHTITSGRGPWSCGGGGNGPSSLPLSMPAGLLSSAVHLDSQEGRTLSSLVATDTLRPCPGARAGRSWTWGRCGATWPRCSSGAPSWTACAAAPLSAAYRQAARLRGAGGLGDCLLLLAPSYTCAI